MPTHTCDGIKISAADAAVLQDRRLAAGEKKPKFIHEACGQRVMLVARRKGVAPFFQHRPLRKGNRVRCPE